MSDLSLAINESSIDQYSARIIMGSNKDLIVAFVRNCPVSLSDTQTSGIDYFVSLDFASNNWISIFEEIHQASSQSWVIWNIEEVRTIFANSKSILKFILRESSIS